MATRRDTLQRKAQLRHALLQSCRESGNGPDEMLPPVRELAKTHNLSVPTATQVIKELISEGVLYTRSTAGTFVRKQHSVYGPVFLMIMPRHNFTYPHNVLVRHGFETRMAQIGNSFCLEQEVALQWQQDGKLPEFSGLFEFDTNSGVVVPDTAFKVKFGSLLPQEPKTDVVSFDNSSGGQQAANHLLQLGHTRIAFLGMATENDEENIFIWSQEREDGWRYALAQAGLEAKYLAFNATIPKSDVHEWEEQRLFATNAARELVACKDITAVISANVNTTAGLLAALREANVPEERWPAVVSFDESSSHNIGDGPYNDAHIISTLRQSWDEIGREAANILWERSQGILTGPAQQRLIPMRLIPRLSCRRDWSSSMTPTSHPASLPGSMISTVYP